MKTKPKTTEELHGVGLLAKAAARREELERTLALVQGQAARADTRQRANALEEALNELDELLPMEIDHLSDATAAQVNTWLEATQYLPTAELPREPKPHSRSASH